MHYIDSRWSWQYITIKWLILLHVNHSTGIWSIMCTSACGYYRMHAHPPTHPPTHRGECPSRGTTLHIVSIYIYYTLTPGTTTGPVPLFTSWCRLPASSVIRWLVWVHFGVDMYHHTLLTHIGLNLWCNPRPVFTRDGALPEVAY